MIGSPTVLQTPHDKNGSISWIQKVDTIISGTDESTSKRYNVHVVVSHCDKNISWIWRDLLTKDYDAPKETEYVLKTASILTKCNVTIPQSDLPQTQNLVGAETALIQVISLPNVGRCDHSYSYWIKEVMTGTKGSGNNHHNTMNSSSDASKLLCSNRKLDNKNPLQEIAKEIKQTDVLLFVKDNDNSYRGKRIYKGLLDMFDELTVTPVATTYEAWKRSPFPRPISRGMVCPGHPSTWKPKSYLTNMAHRGILWTFQMDEYVRLERDKSNDAIPFQSPYRPMRNWITHLLSEPNNKSELETLFSADYFEEVIKDMIGRDNKEFFESRETPDLVPVCFGGIFSTYWGQLASFDSPMTLEGWNAVTKSLSRANNLEEGHYMERWWGELLSWSSFAMIANTSSASDRSQLAYRERGAVSLPKVEQSLMLKDQRFHSIPDYYRGVIQLWRHKVW